MKATRSCMPAIVAALACGCGGGGGGPADAGPDAIAARDTDANPIPEEIFAFVQAHTP